MNTIILCEGKTDAVLLGYYLDKVCGFKHEKDKVNKQLTIGRSRNNTFFTWHKKDKDYMAIWSVGGKDCFKSAIEEFYNVLRKSPDDLTYDNLAIVCDRDLEEKNDAILTRFSGYFIEATMPFQNNVVCLGEYSNSFGQNRNINIFSLIIPEDKLGALETVLLDAIKEDEYDCRIVEETEQFIAEIRDIASKYITSDRLELKAKLSAVFAIISPEKVFSFIDEILMTTVKWEEKEHLKNLFNGLVTLLNTSGKNEST